jgi:hypothetical protein
LQVSAVVLKLRLLMILFSIEASVSSSLVSLVINGSSFIPRKMLA